MQLQLVYKSISVLAIEISPVMKVKTFTTGSNENRNFMRTSKEI